MRDTTPADAKADQRINCRLEGEAIFVGDRRIQPVARLRGWTFERAEHSGAFAGHGGRLTPEELWIDGAAGREVLRIDEPEQPLRAMAMAGAAASAISLVIMLAARIITTRR